MAQKHNKFAVGVFIDGLNVYYVKMNKYNDVIRITQVQSFKLNETEIPANTPEPAAATPSAIVADLDLDEIDFDEIHEVTVFTFSGKEFTPSFMVKPWFSN